MRTRLGLLLAIAGLSLGLVATAAASPTLDAKAIGAASGVEAKTMPDGVVRIGWSRKDVVVRVDGASLAPAAGLGSWAAFAPMGEEAMVMGDTVVFEDEVDAAMDAAFAHGLTVTGLHNHFFHDEPKVYFMHIGGHGPAAELASSVKAVWDAIRKVRASRPEPTDSFGGPAPKPGTLDAEAIAKIVGHPAPLTDGIAKVTVGREGRMHGVTIGASMGLATWAAFSGSDAAATIDGDVMMGAEYVYPTLRALRASGLHVVALHNHMLGETPAYYFTHFWGSGKAADLAAAFRKALDASTPKPSSLQ